MTTAKMALTMRRWGGKSSKVHGGKFANYSNSQLSKLAARDKKATAQGKKAPSIGMGRKNFRSPQARRADARKRAKARAS